MFCRKCGGQIAEDSIFCSVCGERIDGKNSNNGLPQSSYILTIDRKSQVYLINPPIKVTIDGSIRKTIDNGSSIEIPLTPGMHTAEFTSSVRSTDVSFEMTHDIVIEIGWNRVSGRIDANILSANK